MWELLIIIFFYLLLIIWIGRFDWMQQVTIATNGNHYIVNQNLPRLEKRGLDQNLWLAKMVWQGLLVNYSWFMEWLLGVHVCLAGFIWPCLHFHGSVIMISLCDACSKTFILQTFNTKENRKNSVCAFLFSFVIDFSCF